MTGFVDRLERVVSCEAGHIIYPEELSAWRERRVTVAGRCGVVVGHHPTRLCGGAYDHETVLAFAAAKPVVDDGPRLDCGCEAGWRCKQHARMAKSGRPDPRSESVVRTVYGRFRNENREVAPDTVNTDLSRPQPRTEAGSGEGFVTRPATGGRPRQYASAADRQRAYRRRKREG